MRGRGAVVLGGLAVLVGLFIGLLVWRAIRRYHVANALLQRRYDELQRSHLAITQQERLAALGQMASGIAHDISNAISPVTIYAESLLTEEPGLSARGRRNLEAIRRAIVHVSQTVSRMREFYRQREPELVLLPMDLNALVRHAIELTRARWSDMAERQGITYEMRTELSPDVPDIIGSESELRDALVNLIFNSIDSMPNGGPVTFRTYLSAERGPDDEPPVELVHFEISDAGIGMDDDTRRRCMEPFFTTKGAHGTGLGLAMVYGVMQRHGSDIEVESAVGEGTTLRFSFPVPPPSAMRVVAEALLDVTPANVLVIDDDPLIAAAVQESLLADGHQVVTAVGGQAGIDAFRSARAVGDIFQVVITDLGMPGVDGRKVSAAIKAMDAQVLVVLLTGWGQTLLAEGGGIPPHVDCVVSKPPAPSELRAALSTARRAAVMANVAIG